MEASLEEIQNEAVEVLKKLTRAEAVVASKKARAAETSKEEMKQYRHRRKRGFAVLRKAAMENRYWSQKGRCARKMLWKNILQCFGSVGCGL